ncbi:MAG: chalcone isomerase family protein [Calditrichaeota bacterium]|nr:chalcone isomerase family protein [Calditrichota bacterium]MCB9067896.1 chalcone isomerase family protein [Calditrichia bacterium]
MKQALFTCFTVLAIGFFCSVAAQEMVEEGSTGKMFPASVQFSYDGADYALNLTGTTVRKKFVFKVYGVAHYMDVSGKMSEKEALAKALEDGVAKQIVMDFSRDVGADKIQGAYRETFENNTTKAEYAAIESLVNQFIGYFNEEIKEDQQYVLRWLPGGVLLTTINGVEKPAITNAVLARALWSAWLGEDAIVDRENLVSRIAN